MNFHAQRNVEASTWRELAALFPVNPFHTASYVQAMKDLGQEPWFLSICEGQKLITGCAAFISVGRIHRSLCIKSLPDLPDPAVFWEGVLRLARESRISVLDANTVASTSASIPQLAGEYRRIDRWEYVLDLQNGDLMAKMHTGHRRKIRKAEKQQLVFRVAEGDEACKVHGQLIASSMERRQNRGEGVSTNIETNTLRTLLQRKAALMFEAIGNDRVQSSLAVLRAERGAYLQSTGTSPEGMETGASHFLQHSCARLFQEQGLAVYNLGGSYEPDSGLARFKLGFGTRAIQLQAVEAFVGHGVRTYVGRLVRFLKQRSAATSHVGPDANAVQTTSSANDESASHTQGLH